MCSLSNLVEVVVVEFDVDVDHDSSEGGDKFGRTRRVGDNVRKCNDHNGLIVRANVDV